MAPTTRSTTNKVRSSRTTFDGANTSTETVPNVEEAPSSCYSSELSENEMVEQDDELHLIGEQPNQPLLGPKTVCLLLLNLIFICLAVTWLFRQNFVLDLIGTIFITLSAWFLVVNMVLAGRLFAKIREETLLAGKQDDFRAYVRRVASTPHNYTLAPNHPNNTGRTQKSPATVESQPVFV